MYPCTLSTSSAFRSAVKLLSILPSICRTSDGKSPPGEPRRRDEDTIKMNLRVVECGSMDLIHMTQDMNQARTLVSMVLNLLVHITLGSSWAVRKLVVFREELLHAFVPNASVKPIYMAVNFNAWKGIQTRVPMIEQKFRVSWVQWPVFHSTPIFVSVSCHHMYCHDLLSSSEALSNNYFIGALSSNWTAVKVKMLLGSGSHLGTMKIFLVVSDVCGLHIVGLPPWREEWSVIY
jgi:hypothetical protein